MINVDIHTKIIRSDTRIVVARPGARYMFFTQFWENNFVGPDLPGLDFPEFENFEDIPQITERIKRSVEIRRLSRQVDHDEPLMEDLDYYDASNNPRIRQFERVVAAYFKNTKKGDLVVLPPINFKGDALIGEFTGEPSDVETLMLPRYGDEPLSGRAVRWLSKIPKQKLPAQTLDALQKPNPIFLVERSAWPDIFRRAYGSYSFDGDYSARFAVTSERFNIADDFIIQAFFNFVSANSDRIDNDETDLLDLREGAFAAGDAAPELYTNVNSPGGLSLKAAKITPIVIATMFALATEAGPDAYYAAVNDAIVFGNSLATAGDDCVVPVRNQVVSQLTFLGYDKWAEACEAARAAAQKTGISTTVKVDD
ncbi:hypothetical protein [Agrobacterium rosae]|uniref:hypothetical protein n=1 Tax=Agrobacterium rosae TaxID=1972867 RepID=UPI0020341250|nr:hypothetical protein [Agrobacterium rosae]MCM2434109.1 hypothetical protein [Agrobacterium rosae]